MVGFVLFSVEAEEEYFKDGNYGFLWMVIYILAVLLMMILHVLLRSGRGTNISFKKDL